MSRKKKTNDRITVEALKYYVPLFQQGDYAEQKLLEDGPNLTQHERNHLETILKLKNLSVAKIASLSGPLITSEINKLIAGSHLRNREDIFDVLYYAGLDGMKRGLRKFDIDKLNQSSTNYLFQWITTYANKELMVLEAPFGVPPSRFQRYKKISAVRKKLTDLHERDVTNEEIYDYFQSGKADIKNLQGRVQDHDKPSKANLSITLELIQEQEKFEKEMLSVDLIDPLEGAPHNSNVSHEDNSVFSETIFGIFISMYNFTDEAKIVMMNDINSHYLDDDEIAILNSLEEKQYKNISQQWKNLIRDVKGPFYKFLQDNQDLEFDEFDIPGTIKTIELYGKNINSSSYKSLFIDGKAVVI